VRFNNQTSPANYSILHIIPHYDWIEFIIHFFGFSFFIFTFFILLFFILYLKIYIFKKIFSIIYIVVLIFILHFFHFLIFLFLFNIIYNLLISTCHHCHHPWSTINTRKCLSNSQIRSKQFMIGSTTKHKHNSNNKFHPLKYDP